MTKNAVVIDCLRTPVGRSHPQRGYYREVRGDNLAVSCVRALLERTGIDGKVVEDVLLGCTQQAREQGLNVARNVALMSGLGVGSAGATINRLCGSSLQALSQAAHSIVADAEDVHVVGGVEHMHHLPMGQESDVNPRLFRVTSPGSLRMGLTAEFLAKRLGISRSRQDEFATRSHQLAWAATRNDEFGDEIVETFGRDERGRRCLCRIDQCIRKDTTAETLSQLPPVFLSVGGTVTAGNSSPINDGAAAMLVMSDEKAKHLDLQPLVRIRATAVAGVEASMMGIGPVPAVQKALKRAGLALNDIDLFEVNEAFAVQAIACIRLLGIDEDRVNVRGGAIAIGHPLGASGIRIATTLIHSMRQRDASLGVATMCIGVGQGIAVVLERV